MAARQLTFLGHRPRAMHAAGCWTDLHCAVHRPSPDDLGCDWYALPGSHTGREVGSSRGLPGRPSVAPPLHLGAKLYPAILE
jgi:hypothetical protein